MNEMSVRNVNDPMPTGQGDIGTILLSPCGDGHYTSTNIIDKISYKWDYVRLSNI